MAPSKRTRDRKPQPRATTRRVVRRPSADRQSDDGKAQAGPKVAAAETARVDRTPDPNVLKARSLTFALQHNRNLHHNTGNPQYVWRAWQLARQHKVPLPAWVLRYIDRVAVAAISTRTRATDTADRYDLALTEMEAAVDQHRNRINMRQVAKQWGIALAISRRDSPNLQAIARRAAKAHRVSVNRLLARYRASMKPPTRKQPSNR